MLVYVYVCVCVKNHNNSFANVACRNVGCMLIVFAKYISANSFIHKYLCMDICTLKYLQKYMYVILRA